MGDGSPTPVFGEQEDAKQVWYNGSFPVRLPDPIRVGSQGCIDGDALPRGGPDRPTSLIHGIDVRCWASEHPPEDLVGLGGGKLDSSARTSSAHKIIGTGGGRLDSSGMGTAHHTLVATGGGFLDSAAPSSSARFLIGIGGGRLDSSAVRSAHFFFIATGGAKGDSSAHTSRGFKLIATGGAKLNSSATLEVNFMTGEIVLWGSTSIPSGWLECDGSAVSRTTYATLFGIISTTYGVGDGSTTFNLPDFRGRSVVGHGTGSGLTTRNLGDSGGEETHQLSVAELASHLHQYPTGTTAGAGSNLCRSSSNAAGPLTSSNSGSGTAHNTMHPYLCTCYIIKT